MRVFPKNKWRLLISAGVPILLSFLVYPPRWWAAQIRAQSAALFHARVTDRIDALSFGEEWRFEEFLQLIDDESGVDVRFLLVPDVKGETLEEYSVRQARALGLGRDAGRRGLLFVYDTTAKRLRLEVGAQLEGVVTDAFAGYLMREHVRSFFGAGNLGLGMLSTLLMVQQRLREGVLGQEFDPGLVEFIQDTRRLALGGGASAPIQHDRSRSAFLNTIHPSSRETRRHFAPQPTPEAAYRRYLEWLAIGGFATDVPLFTRLSQGYLGSLPMTRGFNDYLLSYEYNKSYRIDVRDSLALLYFTSNPLVGPHFLRRTPQGWVLDMYAEILNTRNYAGGWYTWAMVDTGDDFSTTFADRIIDISGMLRLAGGDNRPLPARVYPGIHLAAAESPDALPEQLTVVEAASHIAHSATNTPQMVVLYNSRARSSRGEFPALVSLAKACRQAGGTVLAFSVDNHPQSIRDLPDLINQHQAPFTAVRLYGWRPGQLTKAMAPLGIRIGSTWAIPLVAVRSGEQVAVQAEGAIDVADMAARLIEACKVSP
jgi:TLP18.3/Psb32/MOLO-1 phosphatase superfamily protein